MNGFATAFGGVKVGTLGRTSALGFKVGPRLAKRGGEIRCDVGADLEEKKAASVAALEQFKISADSKFCAVHFHLLANIKCSLHICTFVSIGI